MRELTVRIRFSCPCLGNVKARTQSGRFLFLRSPGGSVMFLPTWHRANLAFAARTVGRHQDEVGRLLWDPEVDGVVRSGHDGWYRRYCTPARYVLHEAFLPGQVVGVNCAVPPTITDDDLARLMQVAGQYRGLSPWKPRQFGLFTVDSVRPRRPAGRAVVGGFGGELKQPGRPSGELGRPGE